MSSIGDLFYSGDLLISANVIKSRHPVPRMPAMCNFLTDSLTFYDDFMEMYDFSQWLKDNQAGLNDLDE